MGSWKALAALAVLSLCFVHSQAEIVKSAANKTEDRQKRLFSLFQVVSFPNTPCTGTSSINNGTCYTTTECSSKGGSSSGSCADGYGVCCIFKLSCGGTSSENSTYLSQSSSSSITSPCKYTICASGDDVCRIKLDFRTFDIAGPQVGTTVAKAVTTTSTQGGAIGDCLTDTFSVKVPGSMNPPVICGYNTGQHMIVDATPSQCVMVEFALSGSSTSREWDIVVNQYTCGDSHDLVGGPGSGCTQFFTGNVIGTISNYNWPSTDITTTTTHLSNQDYVICVRQEAGYCGICYSPAIVASTASASFGLSVSPATISTSSTVCTDDYIYIPHGVAAPATATTVTAAQVFCGRYLGTVAISTTTPSATAYQSASVCSFVRPFTVKVKFDADEVQTSTAKTKASKSENQSMPGGIIGFKLQYIQTAC